MGHAVMQTPLLRQGATDAPKDRHAPCAVETSSACKGRSGGVKSCGAFAYVGQVRDKQTNEWIRSQTKIYDDRTFYVFNICPRLYHLREDRAFFVGTFIHEAAHHLGKEDVKDQSGKP